MLQPRKTKFRTQHQGHMSGKALRGNEVSSGEYGLMSLESSWITSKQIESARRAIAHHTKRTGKIWVKIFPHKPITNKAAGTRMGSGKGSVSEYVAVIRPGTVMFEIAGVSEKVAKEAFELAHAKLPVKTSFINKTQI